MVQTIFENPIYPQTTAVETFTYLPTQSDVFAFAEIYFLLYKSFVYATAYIF